MISLSQKVLKKLCLGDSQKVNFLIRKAPVFRFANIFLMTHKGEGYACGPPTLKTKIGRVPLSKSLDKYINT